MEDAVRQLIKLQGASSDDEFSSGVECLVRQHGSGVYKELLLQLTGKNLGTTLSEGYWAAALSHHGRIQRCISGSFSLRAALLDFLMNHSEEFANPVFIESDHLDNILHTSVTDGLTGLYNQTHFKACMCRSLSRRRKEDESASAVILLDLDRFKQYNDRCGHLAGDDAIRTVGRIIRDQVRDNDIAARYGGEEFAVFLPNVDLSIACKIAERIRSKVEMLEFPGQDLLDSGNLTISAGVAVLEISEHDMGSLLSKADMELYKAKSIRNSISPSRHERRRNQRVPANSLLEFSRLGHYPTGTAMVFDLSASGVGLRSHLPLVAHDSLELRFRRPFWADELTVYGFVRQVRDINETGLQHIGIEFEIPLESCDRYLHRSSYSKPSSQ